MDKFEETVVNPNIYRQADKIVYYNVNDDKDLTQGSQANDAKHSLQADAYIFAAIAAIIASSVIILLQQ